MNRLRSHPFAALHLRPCGVLLVLLFLLTGLTARHGYAQATYDCAGQSLVPQTECEALVAFYNATDGPNWTNNANWLTGPIDTWFGIATLNGHVDFLQFSDDGSFVYGGNNLTGSVPLALTQLTQLGLLDLGRNALTGTIPTELSQLTELWYLDLSGNSLTGSIPVELSQLANLRSLLLTSNALTGTIPAELSQLTGLVELEIGSNALSGTIPPALGQLINLTELELSFNNFTGTIPPELGQLTNLEFLSFWSNDLGGTIPAELSQLTNMRLLYFNENAFDEMPDLSALTNLVQFWIYDNYFTFEDLEPNIAPNIGLSSADFIYTPQGPFGTASTYNVNPGGSGTLSFAVGGANNAYQWYKDGVLINGATADSLTITNATVAEAGVYTLAVTNSVVAGLTLTSEPITVTVSTRVATEEAGEVPETVALSAVYPNPFNPQAQVTLAVARAQLVRIAVYDLLGRQVALLHEGMLAANQPRPFVFQAGDLPSGVYLLRAEGEAFVETRRAMLVK